MVSCKYRIPYITTIAAAKAAAEGLKQLKTEGYETKPIQAYHKKLR